MDKATIKALLVGGARDGQVYEFPDTMEVINDKAMSPDGSETVVGIYTRIDAEPDREGVVRFEFSPPSTEI